MKTNKINIEFIQEREREKEKEERVFKRKGRIFKNVASKIIKCFSEIFRKLKNVRRKYLLIRTMVVASCNLLLDRVYRVYQIYGNIGYTCKCQLEILELLKWTLFTSSNFRFGLFQILLSKWSNFFVFHLFCSSLKGNGKYA